MPEQLTWTPIFDERTWLTRRDRHWFRVDDREDGTWLWTFGDDARKLGDGVATDRLAAQQAAMTAQEAYPVKTSPIARPR